MMMVILQEIASKLKVNEKQNNAKLISYIKLFSHNGPLGFNLSVNLKSKEANLFFFFF